MFIQLGHLEVARPGGAGLARLRPAREEPDGSVAGFLLEGVVLRLDADLRRLEASARCWNATKGRS